ncbi:MAG TPA: HDOD domain-containing protein, partial [Phycisphaerales bacterium]|nr:HDOD domain-containing protein [Phycisphaerales bacterium]
MTLFKELSQKDIDFNRIENVIKHDAALALSLIQYINSAAVGVRARVNSIRHALALLGANVLKKWIAVAVVGTTGHRSHQELLTILLTRARFSECLACAAQMSDRAYEAFSIGLLSGINVLLNCPMVDAVKLVPVADEVGRVLNGDR